MNLFVDRALALRLEQAEGRGNAPQVGGASINFTKIYRQATLMRRTNASPSSCSRVCCSSANRLC